MHKPEAWDGYNLYSPLDGVGSYLIDNDGRVLHFWDTEHRSYISYLQETGSLIRTTSFGNGGNGHFYGGGAGHSIQELSWDGQVTWEYVYSNEDHLMHHDIEPMPNGNVLVVAWERKSVEEAIAAGRDPELLGDTGLWPLHIIEVSPRKASGGEIVWEWHVWDHLIQDFDETKANYGDVAKHPELIDLNYTLRDGRADWLHANAVAYNPKLDQIILSARSVSEIWIIDHSTTTKEARS